MALQVGTRFGPYEIQAAIGAGGMGEVYRARDTKLERPVAIKILPESVAHDPERLARFAREAKTLAALNHPNIAIIHGLEEAHGIQALVMELVDGPTLADVIAHRALPKDEALSIAKQIAEALEAAHEQGIIHRDLKPANVKVREDGTVKVLDFGLAKALAAEAAVTARNSLSHSPTITGPGGMTGVGVILGTACYMAPEQARGKAVDKRGDIWAFGCVLYEMLAGKRPFDGEDITETLAAVVKDQPDLNAVPVDVRRLLAKCLEKNPARRLRDLGDAWELLEQIPAAPPARTTPRYSGWRLATLSMLSAALATALLVALWAPWRRDAPAELMRFQVPPPEKTGFTNAISVSPDGRKIAFPLRGADNQVVLWVRSLDSLEARPLPGTEGAANGLFWSPDSRFIGFGVGARVRKVAAVGGPPQTLFDLPFTFRGGAWSRSGTIIAGTARSGLFRVPETGGTPLPLTTLDPSRQETWHGSPSFLPDQRHFVYTRVSAARPEFGGSYIGSLDATSDQQDLKRLLGTGSLAGSGAVFASAPDSRMGYLLFERERTLMAQRFDLQRLELVGDAAPIGENLNIGGPFSYSSSSTGVLAYKTGGANSTTSRLMWVDRQGKPLGQVGPLAPYGGVYFADSRKLVVNREEQLWIVDQPRGVFSRLNPGDANDGGGAVSPDGRIAFTRAAGGAVGDIYVRLASGLGQAEPLVKSLTVKHPNDWSLDGSFLIYDEHHPTQRQDLWIVPMAGPSAGPGSERKPIPFLVTPADETFGQFSPDGKWIAYSSDEAGRREVYVQGFAPERVPAASVGKWTVSTAGGDKPRWRRDGKELYYIAPDGQMMSVPVKTTATTFEPGLAMPLFESNAAAAFTPYAVAPDGRFLINTVSEAAAADASPITVLLNWWLSLKK